MNIQTRRHVNKREVNEGVRGRIQVTDHTMGADASATQIRCTFVIFTSWVCVDVCPTERGGDGGG